jgi:hypothetical protein
VRRHHILAASAVASLLAAAWLSPRAVPYNMDEFVHYHALACATAPGQAGLPAFRDGCGLYDLRPPLLSRPWPLRSYLYIGSVPAVPFYPFWRLIGDPVAARVQGAFFALLCLVLAGRLLRVRLASLLIAGLVFPVLLASFLVDEGPVGLSAVLFLSALVALRKALGRAPGAGRLGWAVVAGLVLFLGTWVKLLFAWWLPAVAYFAWSEIRRDPGREGSARRAAPALAAALVSFLLPTAVLLASVDRDGRPYLDTALHRGRVQVGPEDVGEGAARLWSYAVTASRVVPRNVVFPEWPVDVVPGLLALAVVALARRRRREVAAWAGLAGLTLALASASRLSQWPHHFFFPLLLLVLSLAVALDGPGRRTRIAVAVVSALFWTSLAVRWPAATVPRGSSFAKDDLLAALRARGLDRDTFQVHSSWGTYYIAQLFGDPGRIVVYLKGIPDDPGLLEEVRALAAERGRPVLLLSSRRWERIQTPSVGQILGPPARTWRFGEWWAVEYSRPSRGEEARDQESGGSAPPPGSSQPSARIRSLARRAARSCPAAFQWSSPGGR